MGGGEEKAVFVSYWRGFFLYFPRLIRSRFLQQRIRIIICIAYTIVHTIKFGRNLVKLLQEYAATKCTRIFFVCSRRRRLTIISTQWPAFFGPFQSLGIASKVTEIRCSSSTASIVARLKGQLECTRIETDVEINCCSSRGVRHAGPLKYKEPFLFTTGYVPCSTTTNMATHNLFKFRRTRSRFRFYLI